MTPPLGWLDHWFGHEIDFREGTFYVFGPKMAIFMGYFGALLVDIFFGPLTQTFLGVNERPCTKFQDNWMSLNERGVFTPLAAGL